MDISLDLLEVFLQVCQLGSFSHAAKRLHKSQSSVSTTIAKLEKQAGLRLFDRSERPLQLTTAGSLFLQYATEMSNKSAELERSFRELASGIAGEVKIGATPSIATCLLPPILGKMTSSYPRLAIVVITQPRGPIREAVRQAGVDFGIILAEPDNRPEGLIGSALRRERLCFVISTKHYLAQKKRLTLEHLQQVPFVLGLKDSEFAKMVENMLRKNGLSNYKVSFRISTFLGMKESARHGIGIAILPKYAVDVDIHTHVLADLRVRGLELSTEVLFVERPHYIPTPTVASVKQFLKDRLQQ